MKLDSLRRTIFARSLSDSVLIPAVIGIRSCQRGCNSLPSLVTIPIDSGSRLGPHEIISRIGGGGMGEVWHARDTRLDRSVAIKVLPAALTDNERFRARFEREAKTISQMNHPHICTLHDVGRENGISYLVMELLDLLDPTMGFAPRLNDDTCFPLRHNRQTPS